MSNSRPLSTTVISSQLCDGADVGDPVGCVDGCDEGCDDGCDDGRDVGRDVGCDDGRDVGRDVGCDDGRDDGRDDGWDDGWDVGCSQTVACDRENVPAGQVEHVDAPAPEYLPASQTEHDLLFIREENLPASQIYLCLLSGQ